MSHFYYVLSPTIYISILTGTGILVIRRSHNNIELIVAPNAKYLTNLRLFFYMLVTIHAFSFSNYEQIFQEYDGTLVHLGFFIPSVSGTILITLLYISGLINVKEIMNTMKKVAQIDRNLVEKLDATFSDLKYCKAYRYQLAYYSLGTLIYLLIMLSQALIINDFKFLDASSSMKFITYFPVFIDYINDGQYLVMVLSLKYRIQYINKQIEQFDRKNMFIKKIDLKPDTRLIRRLENLMFIHDQLCDVGCGLNQMKGLQLFCSIAFKFVLLLFSMYYSYWCRVIKNKIRMSIYWILWAVFHSITLFNLTVCCQSAASEAQKTSTQIHKLLLSMHNPVIKEKLLIFSLHRLHRPLKFTALEVFNVDATLYLSIIGTISTYLVIMLQYQDKSDSGDLKAIKNITNFI